MPVKIVFIMPTKYPEVVELIVGWVVVLVVHYFTGQQETTQGGFDDEPVFGYVPQSIAVRVRWGLPQDVPISRYVYATFPSAIRCTPT